MPHPLQARVAAIRRQVRRLLVVHGLSRALVVVLPAVLLLGGMDYWLRFEDRGVRLVWSLGLAAVVAWAVFRFLLPAIRRPLGEVAVAQRLEAHFQGLGDQLSSAIEFLGEQSEDPYAGSPLLRRAAVAQTQARVAPLDWSSAINRRPVVWAAAAAGIIVLVAAVICVLSPADSLLAVTRLVNPLGDAVWPPVNNLAFRQRIERLAVGQQFEVELIDLNRNMPEEVRIEYRYLSDSGDEQVEREKMQPVGDMMAARKDRATRSFDYRAEGGDDHKMAWTHVEVVEPPRLKSLEMVLHPPSYTGWPIQPAERRIVALRGTTVAIQGTTTKPLAAAVLHQQNGPDVIAKLTNDGRGFLIASATNPELPAAPVEPAAKQNAFETSKTPIAVPKSPPATSLVIDKSGPYWFELRDREGLVGGPEDRWEIQAIADQPPAVSIQQPSGNLLVTAGATVPVRLTVKDDLAIRTVDLIFTRSDRTEIGETAIRLFAGPEHAANVESSTGRLADGQSQTIDYAWDLGPLKLVPGTHILLTATASDYRPQTAASPPRRLTVITAQELEEHLAQRELLIFNELARILKMQQAARLETKSLEATFARSGRLQKTDVDQLRGDELSQRQVRRSLASPTEGVRLQIVALLGELESNHVVNPELRRRMQGFADEIARLERDELPAIEHSLTDAIKGMENASAATAAGIDHLLTDAGRNQEDVSAALERMLGNLAEWNSIRGITRELLDIRGDQVAAEKATKDIGAQTVTKDVPDLSAEQQAELRRIAERQSDMARRFDKLLDRMGQVSGQLKPTDPAAAEAISDAAATGRDRGVASLMRDAGAGVERNQIGQALKGQASARTGLDELLNILSNRHEQELAGLVKKLRESEAKLAAIRQEQDGLRKKMKEGGEHADQEARRKELERLSRKQQELQEETERLARQLQRLQADKAAASLSRAAERMGQAGKSAGGGDSSGASKNAETAAKDLDEAQQRLAEARRKAEMDLVAQQLARLEDALKGLVGRQQHVDDETVRLEKLRAAQGQLTRSQAQSLQATIRDQQGLADEARQLAENLAGAETFQFVLNTAGDDMDRIAKRLTARDTGPATQELEQDVLSRLKQLVAATQNDKPANGNSGNGGGGSGGGGQQSGGSTRALAEVRLIRLMQEDLNRRTQRLSEQVGGKEPSDEQRAEFTRLAKEQGRLAELTLGLLGGEN